jgi:hypothetical protein
MEREMEQGYNIPFRGYENKQPHMQNGEGFGMQTAQVEPIPLPDMDDAIVSFGAPNMNAPPHALNINQKELITEVEYTEESSVKNSFEEQPDEILSNPGFQIDADEDGKTPPMKLEVTNKNLPSRSTAYSQSPGFSEKNNFNCNNNNDASMTNLDYYAATNWANQAAETGRIDTAIELSVENQPAYYIPNSNKVNFNYQDILKFVSSGWSKVEKELMSDSGNAVNYYSPNNNNTPSAANPNSTSS